MKEYKFSCLPLTFYDQVKSGGMSIVDWTEIGKEIGYDAVDINTFFVDSYSIDELRDMRGHFALPIFMATTYSDFSTPDNVKRATELKRTLEYIPKLAALGVSYYRPTAGQYYEGQDEERAINNIYDCFKQVVDMGKKYGIKVVIENHSVTASWPNPDFVFDSDRFARTWNALSKLDMGINYDTANAFWEGDWHSILNTSLGSIHTVHINDLDDTKCVVAGEGLVPQEEMLRTIFKSGYEGYIIIEDVSFEGREGMSRALYNMKQIVKKALK